MVFDTRAWWEVANHCPLCKPTIDNLKSEIISSAQVGFAIVMWGMELQETALDMEYENRTRKTAIERDSVHCLAV